MNVASLLGQAAIALEPEAVDLAKKLFSIVVDLLSGNSTAAAAKEQLAKVQAVEVANDLAEQSVLGPPNGM